MHKNDFDTLVHNYCRHLGMTVPAIEGHTCVIEHPQGSPVILGFDLEPKEVLVIVPVSDQPLALQDKLAHELLTGGFVGQKFGGAAIGLDPTTQCLTLWRRLPLVNVSLEQMIDVVERTVASARDVREAAVNGFEEETVTQ